MYNRLAYKICYCTGKVTENFRRAVRSLITDNISFEIFAVRCGIERDQKKENSTRKMTNRLPLLRAPRGQKAFVFLKCDIVVMMY